MSGVWQQQVISIKLPQCERALDIDIEEEKLSSKSSSKTLFKTIFKPSLDET